MKLQSEKSIQEFRDTTQLYRETVKMLQDAINDVDVNLNLIQED